MRYLIECKWPKDGALSACSLSMNGLKESDNKTPPPLFLYCSILQLFFVLLSSSASLMHTHMSACVVRTHARVKQNFLLGPCLASARL